MAFLTDCLLYLEYFSSVIPDHHPQIYNKVHTLAINVQPQIYHTSPTLDLGVLMYIYHYSITQDMRYVSMNIPLDQAQEVQRPWTTTTPDANQTLKLYTSIPDRGNVRREVNNFLPIIFLSKINIFLLKLKVREMAPTV